MLTPDGAAPPGAPVAAIMQPNFTRIDLFWIDTNGAIASMWRAQGGPWTPVAKLTGDQAAIPGSPLAAVWDPPAWSGQKAEMISWVDGDGTLNSLTRRESQTTWTANSSHLLGVFPPGVPMTPLSLSGQAELAWVDHDGSLRLFDREIGKNWESVLTPKVKKKLAEFGGQLGAAVDPVVKRIELTGVDSTGAVRTTWKNVGGDWLPYYTQPLHQIALARGDQPMNSARCLNYMATGLGAQPPDLVKWLTCSDLIGLTDFCAKRDATPTTDLATVDGKQRSVAICMPNSHDLDIGEQVSKIAEGVGSGALTALPYVSLVVQGWGCAAGQVYACVTFAAEATALADPGDQGITSDTLDFAKDVAANISGCAGGDIVDCVQVGVKSVGAATKGKLALPGISSDLIDALTGPCADGDFAACAHVGDLATAIASDDPLALVKSGEVDYQACLDGDVSACASLGKQAAAISGWSPLKSLSQGVALSQDCANGLADKCTELGQEMAQAAGLPAVPFEIETIKNARACSAGDLGKCQQVGQEVAKRGFPIVGIPKAAEFAAQCVSKSADCADLGQLVSPLITSF